MVSGCSNISTFKRLQGVYNLKYLIQKKLYLSQLFPNFILNYTISLLLIPLSSNYTSYKVPTNLRLNSNYEFCTKQTLNKVFLWSFKRGRFFPTLSNLLTGHTYITLSLGVFLQFFLKPKSFRKSKQLFILLIHFYRKLIKSLGIKMFSIFVKYTPRYFLELLDLLILNDPNFYKDPFSNLLINNVFGKTPNVYNIVFFNTKNYGFLKKRKRGVLKRKVHRKVIKNNLIID